MYETLLLEKNNGIATITFNRPEAGNAFDMTSYNDLYNAIQECGADDEVRVVILTGAGKHFSAGGDIKEFKALIEKGTGLDAKDVATAGDTAEAIRRCPKPVIAMINGAAVGAGCSIALACEFRVMSPKSMMTMAFVNMGFSGDTGAIYYLTKLAGVAKATEMMALGEPLFAPEALRLGLVTKVSESEETLADTAIALAKKLIAKPGRAIALQKRLFFEFFYRDLPQFSIREGDYMHECSLTEDHVEAVNAFLEKRKPVFKGK